VINSSKARIFLLCGIIAVSVLVAFLYKGGVFSHLAAGKLSLPSRRGETVQNLRAILSALQQHQIAHGGLPAKLEGMGLAPELLEDGAGRPFVYTNRYIEKGYAKGQGEFLIVAMSKPTGHFPFDPKTWSYAIVQTKTGEFSIRSSSDPEQLKP
jgi:hypothetical protein